jgi:hypothetical protein
MPSKGLKRIANVAGCCIIAASGLWSIGAYVDHQMSLAVVHDGMNPGLVAADADAFEAIVHPTQATLSIPQLEASGRAIVVAEGTNGRVLSVVPNESCQGQHYAARVKLLDGPRRGSIVWMCSDSFDMVNHWP